MKNYDEIKKFIKFKLKRGDSKDSVVDFLKGKNLDENEMKIVLNEVYSQLKIDEEHEKQEFGFWAESFEEIGEREQNRELIYQENQRKEQSLIEELRVTQNLTRAIISGFIVSIVVAVVWAFVSVGIGFQHSGFALLVGIVIGKTVLKTGRGVDFVFGISGAILSIWACLLGNTFTILGLFSKKFEISLFLVFEKLNSDLFFMLVKDSLKRWDILIYSIAAYIGYNMSRLKIK